jgi:chloramphenicol-sensitive protein RarD
MSASDNVAGFIMDVYLNLPMALFIRLNVAPGISGAGLNMIFVLTGLGVISTLALLLMIMASQKLDLIVFGFMNYIEPVLLVAVAMLVGQMPSKENTVIYLCVALSVFILIIEGVITILKSRKLSNAI